MGNPGDRYGVPGMGGGDPIKGMKTPQWRWRPHSVDGYPHSGERPRSGDGEHTVWDKDPTMGMETPQWGQRPRNGDGDSHSGNGECTVGMEIPTVGMEAPQ